MSTYFSLKHWFSLVRNSNRRSANYAQFRRNVLDRDHHRCVHCGSKQNLNVHHIKRYSDNLIARLQTKNGITLCLDCHKTQHSWMHPPKYILRKKKNVDALTCDQAGLIPGPVNPQSKRNDQNQMRQPTAFEP